MRKKWTSKPRSTRSSLRTLAFQECQIQICPNAAHASRPPDEPLLSLVPYTCFYSQIISASKALGGLPGVPSSIYPTAPLMFGPGDHTPPRVSSSGSRDRSLPHSRSHGVSSPPPLRGTSLPSSVPRFGSQIPLAEAQPSPLLGHSTQGVSYFGDAIQVPPAGHAAATGPSDCHRRHLFPRAAHAGIP